MSFRAILMAALAVGAAAMSGVAWVVADHVRELSDVPTVLNATVAHNVTPVEPVPSPVVPTAPPGYAPWAQGTPQASELRRIEKPEFTTRSELQSYIAERHDRLRAFAQQRPQQELYAAVSFTRLMAKEEVAAFCATYDIEPIYVEYRAGSVQGGFALITGISLAEKEASLEAQGAIGPDDSLALTYLNGTTRAADWVRAMDGDPAVALVYADHELDRLEGVVSDEVFFMTPPSIFDDYQELVSSTP